MSRNWVIARNVLWNWVGLAVHILAGFIVAPFLIRQLGDGGYGLWILVACVIEPSLNAVYDPTSRQL